MATGGSSCNPLVATRRWNFHVFLHQELVQCGQCKIVPTHQMDIRETPRSKGVKQCERAKQFSIAPWSATASVVSRSTETVLTKCIS